MNLWTVFLFVALIDVEVYAIDRNAQIHALESEKFPFNTGISEYAKTKELIYEDARRMVRFAVDESSSDPSTIVTTYETTQETSGTEGTSTSTSSTTILSTFSTGEPPPTRSAKLGMGLGITLIGLIIIAEIIYFQCFYHGGSRSDSYIA